MCVYILYIVHIMSTSRNPLFVQPPQLQQHSSSGGMKKSCSLKDMHYETMSKALKRMESLGFFTKVDKRKAAIAGHGGFVPGKESANVIGCSFRRANLIATEYMDKLKTAKEDQMKRSFEDYYKNGLASQNRPVRIQL